jgi:hypothetical protein
MTVVDLRRAHDHQFLELFGDGARLHDGAEMGDHGAQDFRTVRDSAEHVRHIAALVQIVVVDGLALLVHLVAVETSDSHGDSVKALFAVGYWLFVETP